MIRSIALVAVIVVVGSDAGTQPGPGRRRPGHQGCIHDPKTVETVSGEVGGMRGCRRGAPGAATAQDDHAVFHFLLDARDRIRREVTELPDGVETLTESDDREVAGKIGEHVRAMYARMKDGRPIHARDPLFAELFRHADAIAITIEPTHTGSACARPRTTPGWRS